MKNKDNLDSKKEKKVNKIKEQLARLRAKLASENKHQSFPSKSKLKKTKDEAKQVKAPKKAKEVKEKKARTIEEAKKEQEAMWKRWQEPPVEHCKLLLDTNIIKDFWNISQARDRLRNYLKKKPFWGIDPVLYLTLDRVIYEFIDESKYPTFYAEDQDYDDVCRKLSSLGKFQDFELETRSEYARRAEELCMSEKYIGKDRKSLSLVDCYLLEYAIEYSCKLVTRDNALIDATKEQIRLRTGKSKLIGPTSPGVFNPNRT